MARARWRDLAPPNEPELRLLPFLVAPGATVIDVGANTGSYIAPLLRMGCKITAFEPNPRIAGGLELMYGSKIRIVRAAASDVEGKTTFRVPRDTSLGGLGTIEPQNALGTRDTEAFEVQTVTIDSFGFAGVGLMKIDVEGHELSVLRGAEQLLKTQRPRLIIESENRHRQGAVEALFSYLGGLGYQGFMIDDGLLSSIQAFDAAVHQNVAALSIDALDQGAIRSGYVNNFVFVPT